MVASEKRSSGPSEDLRDGFTIGDVRVDPRAFRMSSEAGARVDLSEAAMDLLLQLAERQPASVSKAEILESSSTDDPSAALEAASEELSRAFSSGLDRPGYLEITSDHLRLATAVEMPGRGRLAGVIALWREIRKRRVFRVATTYAIVTFVLLQIADAILDTLPVPPQAFTILLALLAIGFPIAILLGWFFEVTPQGIFLDRRKTSAVINRTVGITGIIFLAGIAIGFAFAVFNISEWGETPEDLSIAVLPFDNMSGIPEDGYVCDGIAEELLNELVRVKELRVVGRKASFYYRDRQEEWDTIASKLGASMIIEGSIRRNANTMRVAAQLIDRAGYHIWSDTFDAPVGSSLDILAIQRSIARQVASALPIELSEESRQALERTVTESEEAYQLYLQGRNYLRDADKLERFESAEKLFRDALEADEQFVDALSGLCEAQSLIYQRTTRPQDFAKAASTCTRLVGRDELNAEAYVALGTLNRLSGDFEEARGMFDRALEISPTFEPALYGMARAIEGLGRYAEAEQYYLQAAQFEPGYWQVYNGYGGYLKRGGRLDEAIEQYRKVIQLAPDNLAGWGNLGATYFDSDRWDEALQAWQRGIEIEPDPIGYLNVGTAQYYLGDLAAAERSFRAGLDLWDEFYPLWGKLGAALERQGKIEESREAFENAVEYSRAAVEINRQNARASYYLASYLAHLGQKEEALRWSARAREISPNDPNVHYFSAMVESLVGDHDAAVDSLANALRLGYSVRIIRADPYFQPFLNSAKLAEWLQEDVS